VPRPWADGADTQTISFMDRLCEREAGEALTAGPSPDPSPCSCSGAAHQKAEPATSPRLGHCEGDELLGQAGGLHRHGREGTELHAGGHSACPPKAEHRLPEITLCARLQPPASLCEPAAFCWACENRWLLFKRDA